MAEKIKGIQSHQVLGQALGDIRRREMVRIAWRDLAFTYPRAGHTRGTVTPMRNEDFFLHLCRDFISVAGSAMAAGLLFRVDMRLRPSGSSGLLVSHIDAFGAYQLNKAWTWEQQALIKARPICGDTALAAWFARLRKEIITRPRNGDGLGKEITAMRDRMRHEHGIAGKDGFDLKQGVGGCPQAVSDFQRKVSRDFISSILPTRNGE